jgi:dipeptidyl aminopeptidase/acylaminoacyl peptidase
MTCRPVRRRTLLAHPEVPVPRPAQPDDLYRVVVPTDPVLSPDGSWVAFSVTRSAVGRDGYRSSIWLSSTDGPAAARRLTWGPRSDAHPRFSPDGRTLAFLSDRRTRVEDEPEREAAKERLDTVQVYLLPLDGGEARRLTDLPRGVDDFAWAPDGRTLAVTTTSLAATLETDARRRGRPAPPKPGATPLSDYRYIDRLAYQLNGTGFVDDKVAHLWLVDAATGAARLLLRGPTAEASPVWSPDGRRIAFAANRHPSPDLHERSSLYAIEVASGAVTTVAGGADATFWAPQWTSDGLAVVALGDRFPRVGYRTGLWRFAADGSDAAGGTDLLAGSELKPDASMNSDITNGEPARIRLAADGRHVLFTAPVDGSVELWRVSLTSGKPPRRLTDARHYLSAWDSVDVKGEDVIAAVVSGATRLPEVHVLDGNGRERMARPVSALNAELQAEIAWVEPLERRWTNDGREIQGWLYPSGEGARPTVLEIHGGPHTLYGWSPMLEWQVLAGAGVSVLASNPRGSEGYGEAFNRANLGDWGDGPMADLMAGIDQAIADGLADADRLGVTGGSYGGYLSNWIVGRTKRFKAAVTCRSVADMAALFLTGDISGGEWAQTEFGRLPWEDPDYFWSISPLSLAANIRTPLLIQHAERDLRTTVSQAEALFTVLRSLRRPVRFMRVPDETHELTRSGTPFRRVENLVQVRDWFAHFLVRGARRLPPPPRNRAGR